MQLNQYELIFWCINSGLLKKPYNCAVCKRRSGKTSAMNLIGKGEYFDKYVWKCSYHNCRSQRMIRTGNILLEQFSRIELRVILIFIFQHFTFMIPAIVSKATLGISLKQVREISRILNDWIVKFQTNEEELKGKLGGKGKIVEFDESCFFGRKNHKGRVLKQIWGFGIVERSTGRLFVQIVQNRSAKTLVPIIQKWIDPASKFIISDEWRAYRNLKQLKYNHVTIKHSENFVHPQNPEIYTQTIENRWGLIKNIMKKRGRISRENFGLRLKEISWRIANKKDIQHKLLEIILNYNI